MLDTRLGVWSKARTSNRSRSHGAVPLGLLPRVVQGRLPVSCLSAGRLKGDNVPESCGWDFEPKCCCSGVEECNKRIGSVASAVEISDSRVRQIVLRQVALLGVDLLSADSEQSGAQEAQA